MQRRRRPTSWWTRWVLGCSGAMLLRCAAQVCCSGVLLRCAAQVCCSGVLLRCAAQVCCSGVLRSAHSAVAVVQLLPPGCLSAMVALQQQQLQHVCSCLGMQRCLGRRPPLLAAALLHVPQAVAGVDAFGPNAAAAATALALARLQPAARLQHSAANPHWWAHTDQHPCHCAACRFWMRSVWTWLQRWAPRHRSGWRNSRPRLRQRMRVMLSWTALLHGWPRSGARAAGGAGAQVVVW
jgi:hypothetical protein